MRKIKLEQDTSTLAQQLATMKKKATRVNPNLAELAILTHRSERANKDTRGKEGYVARTRAPNEALPPQHTTLWDKETYRTGMGDTVQAMRPGALDFLKCKSRGLG